MIHFFFKKSFFFEDRRPFCGGHWYPCYGLLVTSPLGFKARVGSLISSRYLFSEIHLWCDTCWPFGGQHGSWAVTYLQAGWWGLKTGSIVSPRLIMWDLANALPTELCRPGLDDTLFYGHSIERPPSFKVRRCDHFGCRWCVPLLLFTSTARLFRFTRLLHLVDRKTKVSVNSHKNDLPAIKCGRFHLKPLIIAHIHPNFKTHYTVNSP